MGCALCCSALWNWADTFPPFMNGIRMTLCHARRKCSSPERAAESIPHTWQHGLKIAQKPLLFTTIGYLLNRHGIPGRFDVCDVFGCPHFPLHHHLCRLWSVFLFSLPLYPFLPSLTVVLQTSCWWTRSSRLSRKPSRTDSSSSNPGESPLSLLPTLTLSQNHVGGLPTPVNY